MADFGIFTFATDYSLEPDVIAREVESRGFESLFLPEHTHIPVARRSPYPGGGELPRQYSHTHDVFVALSMAANATQSLRLATGICLVTEHHPIALAKRVASLDSLSNGRLILGIGAGWNAEEMANHGVAYRDRWRVLRERMLAMRRIWSADEAEYHGEFVDFDAVWSYPKPAQRGGPPVLIGASSKYVFDRIAEYADGWMPIATFPGRRHSGIDPLEGLGMLDAALEKVGRQRSDMDLTIFGLGPELDRARQLIESGFNRIVFAVPPNEGDRVLRLLDRYADIARQLG
jgi:probable F420-dependent oxidoreductase